MIRFLTSFLMGALSLFLPISVNKVYGDNVVALDSSALIGMDVSLRPTQGKSAIFDLNQDGNLDIVGLSGHYDFGWPVLYFIRHRYIGNFGLPRATEVNLSDRHGCVAGDFGSPAGSGLPDRLPDLYCVHGVNEGKPDGRQWRNELYLQKPDHTFPISSVNDASDARVVACEWGVCDMHGRGREAVALDFDRDGMMDFALANDARACRQSQEVCSVTPATSAACGG